MPATKKKGSMVAHSACVITVGARPVEYAKVRTYDARRQEWVEIDNQMEIVDEGDPGRTYAFKPFQKVNPNHEAVKDAPGCFIPLDEVDESDLDSVTT